MGVYSTGEQMRRFFAGQMRLDHHRYEDMTRRVRNPGDIGCWRGEPAQPLGEGLVMNVYKPRGRRPKKPVIAFGNTRVPETLNPFGLAEQIEEFASDIQADLDSLEIGAFRWAYNEPRISQTIVNLHRQYGQKVVLTGHSLGGALAQITGCNYFDHVDSVVTFQSPKISRSYLRIGDRGRNLRDPSNPITNSFHYRMEANDFVSDAGHVLFPGTLVKLRWLEINYAEEAAEFLELLALLFEVPPEVVEIVEDMADSIEQFVKFFLAHTARFFQPFENLQNPQEDIEIRQLTDEYEQIQTEIANINIEETTVEWLRQRASYSVLANLSSAVRTDAIGRVVPLPPGSATLQSAGLTLQRGLYVLVWEFISRRIREDPRSATTLSRLNFTLSDAQSYFPRWMNLPVRYFFDDSQITTIRENIASFLQLQQDLDRAQLEQVQ